MSKQSRIFALLQESLNPFSLDVINESHKHNKGGESHYKVIAVSDIFEGKKYVI